MEFVIGLALSLGGIAALGCDQMASRTRSPEYVKSHPKLTLKLDELGGQYAGADLTRAGGMFFIIGGLRDNYQMTRAITTGVVLILYSLCPLVQLVYSIKTKEHKNEDWSASSVYQDLSIPFMQTFKYLLPQLCAMFFYCSTLWPAIDLEGEALLMAYVGALFVPMFFEMGLGKQMETRQYWVDMILRASRAEQVFVNDESIALYMPTLLIRGFVDNLVNVVFAGILCFSLPVFLAHSESRMDLVLNAMAMMFVIDLDNTEVKVSAKPAEHTQSGLCEVLSVGVSERSE